MLAYQRKRLILVVVVVGAEQVFGRAIRSPETCFDTRSGGGGGVELSTVMAELQDSRDEIKAGVVQN